MYTPLVNKIQLPSANPVGPSTSLADQLEALGTEADAIDTVIFRCVRSRDSDHAADNIHLAVMLTGITAVPYGQNSQRPRASLGQEQLSIVVQATSRTEQPQIPACGTAASSATRTMSQKTGQSLRVIGSRLGHSLERSTILETVLS